jgi:hypothetical protein
LDYYFTGSVKVFANPSAREKDTFLPSAFVDTTRKAETLESILRNLQTKINGGATDVEDATQRYLDAVNATPTAAKNQADVEILRHAPTAQYTINTAKKLFVQNRLMPYYRSHRPSNHWAYPNYHSINFFTCSYVPSNAAWLYPNVQSDSYPSGCYSPSGSFTLEFFINPRYGSKTGIFNAGTILHLSSTFVLSLVSGSSVGSDMETNGFRLLLQLSSSADVRPSQVTPGSGSGQYAYLSDDNSLLRNRWHHCFVTWGTNRNDAGTGSFYIDGERVGTFVFPYESILPRQIANAPGILTLGNYYVGSNANTSSQTLFFASDTAVREGVYELNQTAGIDQPLSYSFNDQLNAELHDISIREEYLTQVKARALGQAYPKRAPHSINNYLFYVPPFFVPGAPTLTEVNGKGGLLISPFHTINEASKHPFSAPMSFGVAGRYNSLENFTRDFVTGRFARVHELTMSLNLESTIGAQTCNDYLYGTSSVRLRNLNVLPCDDGNFRPNFDFLASLDLLEDPRFVDDLGAPDLSLISLRNMVTGSIYASLYHQTGSMVNDVIKLVPESLQFGAVPSGLYAVHQRTQDATSNEVVFFDISNLFYGERIKPGSFVISDTRVSGSNGRVGMRLQDDGNGGLFRAQSSTKRAQWNHIGNIFYEEGIILIKSPAIPFFGMEGFDIEFEGEKTINAMKLNVLVDATSYNTSSNPSWTNTMSASFNVNRDPENQKFVTISGVNFHDENLNVVMRAQLAQPIVKRPGDRYLIRVRYDY